MSSYIKRLKYLCIVAALCMMGCHPKPPVQDTAMEQMNATMMNGLYNNARIMKKNERLGLPSQVERALMPKLNSFASGADEPKRFDIEVKDLPAKQFFMGLVKGTDLNMMVDPKVEGNVTLNLKNVTIQDVMRAVSDVYGYGYHQTAYGYRVVPNDLETRIFTVNYLAIKRQGHSETIINTKTVADAGADAGTASSTGTGSTTASSSTRTADNSVETDSKSDFWAELTSALQSIIGTKEGRSVVLNPQTGTVVVHALPAELQNVADYLDTIQSSANRQVILEAKILEVNLSDAYQAGIDWNVLGLSQKGNQNFNSDSKFGETDFKNMFTLNISDGWAFNTLVQLLSTEGNVQVLSSPRISTLNNQNAVLKVGRDQFFVTNVSSQTDNTAGASTTSQNIELTPFFSGISLDVTPQIDAHGGVLLHIRPSVSDVKDQVRTFTVNDKQEVLPLADSTIRETDSVVYAKNGQIVVIGGLMQNKTSEHLAGMPGISDAPVVGAAFRSTGQLSSKTELVILLKPCVIDVHGKAWSSMLHKDIKQFRKLDRGFHYGGKPKVFGSLAEPKW